jgi:hypothetical protein
MALSHKKLQRKNLKKQKKLKQVKAKKYSQIASPSEWTIDCSLVYEHIWEEGIGAVAIVRRSHDGKYILGNYLIDVWALGLKDSFIRQADPQDIFDHLKQQPMKQESPSYCKALILAACDYSYQNGLRPNINNKCKAFIENISCSRSDFQFEFGKDGKPLYISGPYDGEIIPAMTV